MIPKILPCALAAAVAATLCTASLDAFAGTFPIDHTNRTDDPDSHPTLILADAAVSIAQLKANGYQIDLPLTCSVTTDAVGVGIVLSDGVLGLASADETDGTGRVMLTNNDNLYWYAMTDYNWIEAGDVIDTLTVTITKDAKPGDVYEAALRITSHSGEPTAVIEGEDMVYSRSDVYTCGSTITILDDDGSFIDTANGSDADGDEAVSGGTDDDTANSDTTDNDTANDSADEEGTAILMGDVDEDGFVSALDAHRVLTASAAYALRGAYDLSEEQFSAADVNGDSSINAIDAHYILLYSAYYNLGVEKTWEEILAYE